jgi:ADP-ribose pyrophosphatase
MLTPLEKISSVTILKNPYWEYKHDTYTLPSSKVGDYYYVHTNGSVFVIPQLSNGDIVLCNQYRYLNQRESLEFPGGGLKSGIEPEVQAREELQEEAGYRAGTMHYLGVFNPMNGVTDELCHVFVARELELVQATPEESEEFEIVRMSPVQIREAIRSNHIWDGMTLAAWAMAEQYFK